MTDKQIIIDDQKKTIHRLQGECTEKTNAIIALGEKLKIKEQEYEKLRQYHNKCCEEFEKEKKEWLEKYNQVSRDFYSGKYCNAEKCQQLDQLKAENDELKKCYKNNSALLDFEETNTTKLVNKVMKLEKTLTEIKEIAENAYCLTNATNKDMAQFAKQILQKISEVEE